MNGGHLDSYQRYWHFHHRSICIWSTYITRGIETPITGAYVSDLHVTRGIETYTTGVYVSDLHILLEVLKLPSKEHMYLIYLCY